MSPHPVFSAPKNRSQSSGKARFGAVIAAALAAATVVVVVPNGVAEAATRGATVPFLEQEAETAATNGSVIGPNRNAGTLAGEASGRKAVTLSGQGQYVEFTLTAAANSVDVRYSLPDSAQGTISLYVNGSHNRDLALTSKYGWYYGSYPFTNNPGDGKAHHFYDETRALLGTSYPAGTKIKLQVDAGDVTPATIDLADFQQVGAAATQPANSLSVTAYGATAGDSTDDAAAFDAAVAAAKSQAKEVWIPAGSFVLSRHITVDRVTLRGAGPWYSELHGARAGIFGLGEPSSCGVGGNTGVSQAVKLYDFAILGEVTERNDCDQVNGIGGALGGGSVVQNLWIQHTKVGLWLDGPFDGLTVTGNRILDQTADGLNLHQGISNVTVTNNFLRNTGDDGLAMWSEHQADHNNTFSFNTVLLPILANNIAIYGGSDNTVSDNVVADNQDQGGGLHIANRFSAVPLAGTTTVARNTAIRTGVLDSNWQFGVGALWFDGRDSAITGRVDVTDNDLLDNNYEGVQFIDGATTNVNISDLRITGAGTFAWQLQAKPSGTVKNVVASGIGRAGVYNCMGPDAMTGLVDQGGNSGWSTTFCGAWPTPVYGSGQTTSTTAPTTTTTTAPPTGNLALHKAISASGSQGGFPPANAVDGDANSYWESANNAFPQSITVDLGSSLSVSRLVLKLPGAWGTRTQTLSVDGSANGSAYSSLKTSAGYAFNPGSGNTATVSFPATSQRYLRLTFTANTGWPAGQLSELEAYSS